MFDSSRGNKNIESVLTKLFDRSIHSQAAKTAVSIDNDMLNKIDQLYPDLHGVISSVGRMSHCGCEGRWFEPNMTHSNLAVGEFV